MMWGVKFILNVKFQVKRVIFAPLAKVKKKGLVYDLSPTQSHPKLLMPSIDCLLVDATAFIAFEGIN